MRPILASLVMAPLLAVSVARAETVLAEEPAAAGAERPASWGFSANVGVGSLGGDFSTLLRKPVTGDMNIFRTHGPWRLGLGLSLGSLTMKPPYDQEHEWGLQRSYLFATRMLRTEGTFRPYLQARLGLARLHPRSLLFNLDPLPEGFALGDSSTKAANGFSVGVVPGLEWNLNKKVALDFSASVDYFSVDKYDLSPVGLGPASSGTTVEGRVGVRWHPDDGYPSGPPSAGAPKTSRDAWGVGHNYGWAAAEVVGINWFTVGFNEYVRNANFNQVSPRGWWTNITDGFTYDDNEFKTNQWSHPFNGAAYFNSARSNGLNYWTSAAYAGFGAFFWECCGETHPMSLNDMASTTLGGIALGEMQYRLTSEILDNQATGASRFFKEFGSFFIDPVREFNRILSGRNGGKADNPTDPMDWRPPHGANLLMLGARVIGEGESLGSNTKSYANFGFDHVYGNPFDNSRRKPFDTMEMAVQFSAPEEKVPMNLVRITGDLWEKPLGDSGTPNHVFAIIQRFDYMNNTAFEFGGQSLGATLYSRFKLSPKLSLTTRVDGTYLILGAVNSDYAKAAVVADQERLREYDYGPGPGAAAQVALNVSGRPWLTLGYRFQKIGVTNGSILDKGVSSQGSDATHHIQAAGGRLVVPIFGNLGLGADGYVFLRKSHYTTPGFNDIDQRNPQVRVFVALSSVR